jgi:hypothetical protein
LLLRERYFSPMAGGAYAVLGDDLREQLVRIEPSTDGHCSYRPCRVTLHTGEIRDFVYVVEAESYFAMWGVWRWRGFRHKPPRRARSLSQFHQTATPWMRLAAVSDSPLLIYLSPAPLRGVAAAAEAVTKTSSAQRRRQRETVDGERRDSGLRQRGHEPGGWRTARWRD